ncbi:predicted protein [Thalassiosira pseudonana CCMP1335]|uniref:Uncharacterized protein n=1 Tax=Thalassiosira pseudonana TaxID=35128 RepID=B8LC58_THAPS|nr:predicted protein [Thalassiosira pseudonana CCMP1335]EED87161.1 predicted protein [Thalassiosira pseudonana CCMP1335]|eukprot:g5432.t1 g5432   contig2:529839-530408(-)
MDVDNQPTLKTGQKFPTPTPGNGDRVFYETLLRQRPDSEMAQEWCVNYGVLSEEEAAKAYKAVVKRKGSKKASSTSPTPSSKSAGTKKKKKVKKVLDDVAYDAGMDAGGDQGIGVADL